MVSDEKRNTIIGSQGWREFLGEKEELLAEYQLAQRRSRNRPTPGTEPGEAAEAVFRRWLTRFLPERYGVTSGFVISPGLSSQRPIRHYDVIIYDRANSPVLWRAEQPDHSPQGTSVAIPVEYVRAIFEVKSTLTKKSVKDSAEKLDELAPLLSGTDDPGEAYPIFLPEGFACGVVFYQVSSVARGSHLTPLAELAARLKRGFWGGLALSSIGDPTDDQAARLRLLVSTGHSPYPKDQNGDAPLKDRRISYSDDVIADDKILNFQISWSINEFGLFAHDLVAILADRFDIGRLSSMHGYVYDAPVGAPRINFPLDPLDEAASEARKKRQSAGNRKKAATSPE